MPRLILYARSYCHLCEDMLQALAPHQARHGFTLEVVDIDRDPQLQARYNEKVPVLSDGEQELCHYFLDEAALDAYFARAKGA